MRVLLTGGSVWDGGDDPPQQADIVVEDGVILDVHPGLDGDVAVDITGKTVLPGLFDCHVHMMLSGFDLLALLRTSLGYRYFEAGRNLGVTLAAGITTVRDAGGADAGVRNAVRDGLVQGPRMQVSITMMSQTGGHGDFHMPCGATVNPLVGASSPNGVVDGVECVRRVAREIIRAGADVIKVATTGGVLSADDDPRHSQFQADELAVILAEARAAHLPVMAHAQGAQGIKNALHAGVRSIEHGIFLDDEAIDLMLKYDAFLVPTLMAPEAVVIAGENGASIAPESVRKATEVIEEHRVSFGRAAEAGVRIAMGTDSGVMPHGNNLRELVLMNAAGLRPSAALRAASSSAATLMGLSEDSGTVEKGKRADFLIVEGDAFDLATLADRVHSVWQDGSCVAGEGLAGEVR